MPDCAIHRPPLALAAAEPFRAIGEFMGLFMASPMLLSAPRGEPHVVLVLPGFGATDMATFFLRRYIDFLGYHSATWSMGRNLGYRTLGEGEERLRARVRQLARKNGHRISIVGWSLGGVMARHMAREHPEHIRRVITLGAPFTGNPSATSVRGMYELLSGDNFDSAETMAHWQANQAPPQQVPTTSIYSRTDGVTAWQNCLETETRLATNVEVMGSHMGLPHNPLALYAMAEQLALPAEAALETKPAE